jgi:hypothetical protein
MYAAETGLDPTLAREALSLVQLTGIAFGVGWAAERLLDTGIGARGLPFLCGIAGLYAGARVWDATGWPGGPAVAGHALVPALAGALAIAGVFKLVGLGVAGPRR